MSEKRYSVQIEKSVEVVGKKPKSACIFDKQENKVYMLTLFTRLDSKKSVKTYIDNLFEIVDVLNEQQAIIEEQEKVIKKQRKEYINLKENMDALRRTWAKRYKHKKRRVWNY